MAQDMEKLPVRQCQIVCRDHPEWGSWGVMEDHGDWYDIHGASGWRVLFKSEAAQHWETLK